MTAQHAQRPVLVGIDGTASGLEALSLGTALGVLSGAPLLLTAVYGYEARGVDVPGPTWPSHAMADQHLRDAEQRLGDTTGWRSMTIPATTPARGLIETAELENAEVIVLGSCHRGAVGRVLAGSTARKVVHGAPCAVAVVPHGWSMRPNTEPVTIGVAVTDSAESRAALAIAAQLAEPADARLKVLHAVHLMAPANPYFGATGTSYAEWVRGERRYGENLAHGLVDEVLGGRPVDVEILSGDCVERLTEASESVDMLVLGSRAYGPVHATMAGSVSLPLIERAHCPVLIVPRGAAPMLGPTEAERASVHA